MFLKKLSLTDYRNNKSTVLEFSEKTNIVFGENGAGKTNMLEAVFFFAAGKSFRGCKEKELISFDKNNAFAEIVFESNGREQRLAVEFSKKEKKKITRNGIEITKLSEYFGQFRAVIFSPEHLSLIKGAPEQRRKFLDMAICQAYPRYVAVLSEYNRLLLQKNALLKREMNGKNELLSVYNEKLALTGGIITARRQKYFQKLSASAEEIYSLISDDREALSFRFETQLTVLADDGDDIQITKAAEQYREEYLQLLNQKQQQEIIRQTSLYGAHKDDFSVQINGREAKSFASQGQQRSAVLALKLSEGEISKTLTGEYPVFLLDDIMSELDDRRKKCISEKLIDKQVIITGCDESISRLSAQKKYFVSEGCFSQADGE